MAVKTANTDKREINYQSAMIIAGRLEKQLRPLCKKFSLAGSLRRKEAYVGDIEIVCIPKRGQATPPGQMFPVEMNLVIHHIRSNAQSITGDSRGYKIKKGGERYYQVIFAGVQCDIFMTNEEQWGRMLALRTGPDSFSIKIASRWRSMGYKGHNGELVRIRRNKDGTRLKPSFPTEKDIFEFLGWDYIEPENRE